MDNGDIKVISAIIEKKRNAEEDLEKIMSLISAFENKAITTNNIIYITEGKTIIGKAVLSKLLIILKDK